MCSLPPSGSTVVRAVGQKFACSHPSSSSSPLFSRLCQFYTPLLYRLPSALVPERLPSESRCSPFSSSLFLICDSRSAPAPWPSRPSCPLRTLTKATLSPSRTSRFPRRATLQNTLDLMKRIQRATRTGATSFLLVCSQPTSRTFNPTRSPSQRPLLPLPHIPHTLALPPPPLHPRTSFQVSRTTLRCIRRNGKVCRCRITCLEIWLFRWIRRSIGR